MNTYKNNQFSLVDGKRTRINKTNKGAKVADIWPDLIDQERDFLKHFVTIKMNAIPNVRDMKRIKLSQLTFWIEQTQKNEQSSKLRSTLLSIIQTKIEKSKS